MGDEFVEAAFVMLPDGDIEPLAGAVGLCSDVASPEPGASWSGSFTVPAGLNAKAFDAIVRDHVPRSFVVELDRSVRKSFPGPSRFMRSRRMWQCRRGRRNANAERRKLSRKRRHTACCKQRLVFPNTIITTDVEKNEFKFEVYGGTCSQGPTP